MDYKYIEQLLERYFQGETTLQEEQILKSFFAQGAEQVPEELRSYTILFEAMGQEEQLGDEFDDRIMAMIEEPVTVKARTIKMSERLRPLFKAAAVVAIILTLGNAMNLSLRNGAAQSDEINYAEYKDTYEDPTMAYDKVEDALQLMSEGFMQTQHSDSLASDTIFSKVR